jgi:hypothetical protein
MNRYIERTEMKLLAATVISISLLSSASAQTTTRTPKVAQGG